MKEETAWQSEEKRRNEEKDEFWSIDMLLPQKKTAPRRAPGALDATEISFGGEQNAGKSESCVPDSEKEVGDQPFTPHPSSDGVFVRHFVPPHTANEQNENGEPVIAYEKSDSLIHRVKVYRWSAGYRYYSTFCEDAARLLRKEPTRTPPALVSFFSYVPQYSQLSEAQTEWYLYWRQEFRNGNPIETSDSYLYLYLYEILNTAGYETDPLEGLRMLFRVFHAYGAKNPNLARLLSEWICDYALIFRLEIPDEERQTEDFRKLYRSTLMEFYMLSPTSSPDGYAEILTRYCSSYDYRKSHFYTGANAALFDAHLPACLAAAVRQCSSDARLFAGAGLRDSHVRRDAFQQALCSYRIRLRLELDLSSFSRSHGLRFLVSDILKYGENRLRAYLGIKSRLTVYSLTPEVRNCLNRYFDEHLPKKSPPMSAAKKKQKEEEAVYEKMYDLPEKPLDLSNAMAIEYSSWETTRRLTEAFGGEEIPAPEPSGSEPPEPLPDRMPPVPESLKAPEPAETTLLPEFFPPSPNEESTGTDLSELLGDLYPFALAALDEDFAEETAFARRKGMMPDLIADQINEKAADFLGDILLEASMGGYRVPEEYRTLFIREETN